MRVSQIVSTIVGEGVYTGEACLLVRLSGCNLHCKWCDTPTARRGGSEVPFAKLVDRGIFSPTRWILLTGGEPLLQRSTPKLISRWLEGGKNIIVETNGTVPVQKIAVNGVSISMDVKTPSSGEDKKFLTENLNFLRKSDAIKFVISDKMDFDWSKDFVQNMRTKAQILFQPAWGRISPQKLAHKIIEAKLPVRLSVQLHKIIKME